MGIFGVLALLQNYKPILRGRAVIKLSAEYYPTRENLLLCVCVCVCFLSLVAWSWHLRWVLLPQEIPVDWQMLIALKFFLPSFWFTAFKRCLCSAKYSGVSLPMQTHLNRHRCTNAPSMTHILTPHFHHSAPETCSLSGESSRFNPVLLPGCLDRSAVVKLSMMDAHRIKAMCVCVCVCVFVVWSHRWSLLLGAQ